MESWTKEAQETERDTRRRTKGRSTINRTSVVLVALYLARRTYPDHCCVSS